MTIPVDPNSNRKTLITKLPSGKVLEESIHIRRGFQTRYDKTNDEVLKDFDKMKDAMIQKCAETRNKR